MTASDVRKAVIPVAGLGTRFLPITSTVPKEMLPILNRPIIDWIVKACIEADFKEIVFISRKGKECIKEYFDIAKFEKKFSVKIYTVFQDEPRGLGHAILQARKIVVHDAYFGVLLPDEIFFHPSQLPMAQMVSKFKEMNVPIVGLWEVPPSETYRYGIASIEETPSSGVISRIRSLVEKPSVEKAPSNWALPGRYILPSSIFSILETLKPGAKGEIQLTDALNILSKKEKVFGLPLSGVRFDAGTVSGFVDANVFADLFIGTDEQTNRTGISLKDDVVAWEQKWNALANHSVS